MTNREVERRLAGALERLTPDVFEAVVSGQEGQKGNRIFMIESKKRRPLASRMAGIAAALVLLLGGFAGAGVYQANYRVASTVSLDVNPSIEIQVNRKEHVLAVNALNEDGRTVIGDMDFQGSSLEITLNALIGSMLRNGYLSELANSILVTVDGDDSGKTMQLQQKLTEEINLLLQTQSFSGAVLSQTLVPDAGLQALAERYGITLGKAQLIQQLITQNTRYSFADLAELSINELNLLSESGGIQLENINSVGTASDKGYIGFEKAKEAALAHAGLEAGGILHFEYEMDYEQGVLVYEIEFDCDGYSYDYDIHALTGEVLSYHREADDDGIYPYSGSCADGYIGGDAALEAACVHAGLTMADVSLIKCVLEYDDGVPLYEIEFYSGGCKYEYEIHAGDAGVIQYGFRQYDAAGGNWPAQTAQPDAAAGDTAPVSAEQARDIALAHAGVLLSEAYKLECELDWEDGVKVYEVEFKSAGKEYSYTIAAADGRIIEYETEQDD